MKTSLPCFALLVSSLLLGGAASAQDAAPGAPPPGQTPAPAPEAGAWTALAARPKVGLEYDLWPAADFVAMTWDVGAHIQIAEGLVDPQDRLLFDVDYAWGYFTTTGTAIKTDQLAYGNPTAGAHLALPLDKYVKDLRAHAGFAWTAPVLNDPEPLVAISAAVGSNMRGGFLLGRMTPFYMAFRFDVGAEYRVAPNLYYRGSLNPVIYVPTNGKYPLDSELVLEQGNELEYRADSGLGGGARLQEAFTLTSDDLVQLSAEVFVAYTPEKENLYARLGMFVALDEGAGFGFDKNKLATVNLGVGYHLK